MRLSLPSSSSSSAAAPYRLLRALARALAFFSSFARAAYVFVCLPLVEFGNLCGGSGR